MVNFAEKLAQLKAEKARLAQQAAEQPKKLTLAQMLKKQSSADAQTTFTKAIEAESEAPAQVAVTVNLPTPQPLPSFKSLATQLAQADATRKLAERIGNVSIKPQVTHECVAAPMISLKGMIAKQQDEFAKQFNAPAAEQNQEKIITAATALAQKEMEFDQSQYDAVQGMLREQYCCLIGAAGTGKTKTLKDFLLEVEDTIEMIVKRKENADGSYTETKHLAIGFFAFTGRAVEQMKRSLPEQYHNVCGTIHGDRCLNYVPEFYEEIDDDGNIKSKMRFVPTYNEGNKLTYSIIVIDEAGMLSVDLWNTLWAAIKEGTKVILVGDINQLPPVYGRSILGYALTKWPVFQLTKIHRTAQNNPIIANAHRVLEGHKPIAVKGLFDMEDLGDRGSSGTQQHFLKLIKHAHKCGIIDPFRDGIIVPQNVGPIGQTTLNEYLLAYFNPPRPDGTNPRQLIKTGIAMVQFAVGDKVMMLANDKSNNLTNGQIGQIVAIAPNGKYKNNKGVSQQALHEMANVEVGENDHKEFDLTMEDVENYDTTEEETDQNQRQASHIVYIRFGEKEYAFATAGEFRRIAHAYVITCHKSQGGEYPVVIVLVHSANNKLLSREWLYTALTRARERVILVFNARGLQVALQNQRIKGRTIEEKIQSFIKISEQDALDDSAIIPILPEKRSA